MSIKTIILQSLKYFALAFCLLWAFINTFVQVVGYDQAVMTVAGIFQVPVDDLIADPTEFSNPTLDKIQSDSYTIFYIASIVSAIIGTIVLSQGRSFSEIVFLFVGYAIPRQRKFWGLVYDSKTGKPVALASIRLQRVSADGTKEFIAETVSDLDGRYRLNINKPGAKYFIEVSSPEYKSNMVEIPSGTEDLNKEITRDIELNKEEKEKVLNLGEKWDKFRSKIYLPTIIYMYIFVIAGILFSIYGIVAFFPSPTSMIFIVIYICSFIWNTRVVRERLKINVGKVIDSETKKPLESVMVKIFDLENKSTIAYSDQRGQVQFTLPPGSYKAQFIKDNYQSDTSLLPVKLNDKGLLDKNVVLKRTGDSIQSDSSLLNPFK